MAINVVDKQEKSNAQIYRDFEIFSSIFFFIPCYGNNDNPCYNDTLRKERELSLLPNSTVYSFSSIFWEAKKKKPNRSNLRGRCRLHWAKYAEINKIREVLRKKIQRKVNTDTRQSRHQYVYQKEKKDGKKVRKWHPL